MHTEINIDLQDTEWELDYIDHDRNIARAIVYDESGQFYFVRAQRDDDFGKAKMCIRDRNYISNYHAKKIYQCW